MVSTNILFILRLCHSAERNDLVPFFNLLLKVLYQYFLSFHLHLIFILLLRSRLLPLILLEKVFYKFHYVLLDRILLLLSLSKVRLYSCDLRIYLFSVNVCILEVTKDVLGLKLLLQVVLSDDVWDKLIVYESTEPVNRINLIIVSKVLWNLPLLFASSIKVINLLIRFRFRNQMSPNIVLNLLNTLTFHRFNLPLKSLNLHHLPLLIHLIHLCLLSINLRLLLFQIFSLNYLIFHFLVLDGSSFGCVFYCVHSFLVS